MTATLTPAAPAVTWSRVDEGFYVGSNAGAFIGHIEADSVGTFVATNGRGQRIGTFPTLIAARDQLSSVAG